MPGSEVPIQASEDNQSSSRLTAVLRDAATVAVAFRAAGEPDAIGAPDDVTAEEPQR